MPNFFKKEYTSNENREKYKKELNQKYKKTLLYDYYLNIILSSNIDKNKFIKMHPLVISNILKLSNDYILAERKNRKGLIEDNTIRNSELKFDIDTILYKNFLPLDVSAKNYLYLKLLKFHFGMRQFLEIYSTYQFDKLHIDDSLMNDYLNKKFIVCLDNSKKELRNKVNELSDFQIISNICVKERLTLYNFLNGEMNLKKTEIKNYINNQYIKVLRNRKDYTIEADIKHVKNKIEFSNELKNITIDDIITPYSK